MGACLGTNIDAHATDEPPQEQESYLSSLACSLAPSLVEKHFVQTAVQALARPPRLCQRAGRPPASSQHPRG